MEENCITLGAAMMHLVDNNQPLTRKLFDSMKPWNCVKQQRTKPAIKNVSHGPGTELSKLISWFASACNRCKIRIEKMDRWGVDGCRKNKQTIIGWLLKEAEIRSWPTGRLTKVAVSVLVETAIQNAQRKERRNVTSR